MSLLDALLLRPIKDDPLNDLSGIIYCIENLVNGMKYIGMTKKTFCRRYSGGRWWDTTHNPVLLADYTKYGDKSFRVLILEHGLKDEELPCIEGHYIYHFNTFYPNGYNMSYDTSPMTHDGLLYRISTKRDYVLVYKKEPSPEGVRWHMGAIPCSEETKRKISLANKGKKRTSEQCERISLKIRGRKQSPEEVAKRSLSLKGKHTRSVFQIDPETGNIIKEHPSIQDAAEFIGLNSSANLTSVCKGRQKTAGGYIFKYKS